MSTATQNATFVQAEKTQKAPLTLATILAAVFLVDLRETLAAQYSVDRSDSAYAYGL